VTTAASPGHADGPAGLRLLVVEDEMLLAMALGDMLADLGCEVIGPVARVAEAVRLAGSGRMDGAILDVNIAGVEVYPVAQELARRGIPFIFLTGYSADKLSPEWRDRPLLQKPVLHDELVRRIVQAFAK
jgi:CheY-like chemotaxis protein